MELALERALGMSPVDQDFPIPLINNLAFENLEERSVPFYPIRMTLETESPGWLGKMRVNMSGAEGVWTGTGIDDGIGAAVQYVSGFARYQDRTPAQRQETGAPAAQPLFRAETARRGAVPFYVFNGRADQGAHPDAPRPVGSERPVPRLAERGQLPPVLLVKSGDARLFCGAVARESRCLILTLPAFICAHGGGRRAHANASSAAVLESRRSCCCGTS